MYPKYLNFACPLHTYAFQQFLLQNGIESTIIDYKPVYFNNFDMRHPSEYYKQLYEAQQKRIINTPEEQEEKNALLSDYAEKITAWEELYEEREIRYEKFQNFINTNYIKTEEEYDSDFLEVKDPGFDCYICVTDVIWNLLPTHTYDRGFFLASKAMEGKQKIAYAASRGVPKPYTDDQLHLFFHYLADIDFISVRESSLKTFIEENSNRTAEVVLDPVMLQEKSFWQKISIKPNEKKYILLYYVMEKSTDTINRAVEYAKKHDLLLIELSDRPVKGGRVKDDSIKHIARYDIGMEEWLGYIEHAECIFTNSFHGCCFSILFEKLFYVGNRKGDKVTNILETFDLQQLRLPTKSQLQQSKPRPTLLTRILRKLKLTSKGNTKEIDVFKIMPTEIDYSKVNSILNKKRDEAKHYILNALYNAEQMTSKASKTIISSYDDYRRKLTYPLYYFSNKAGVSHTYECTQEGFHMSSFPNGTLEYSCQTKQYHNDGTSKFEKNKFISNGYDFTGWNIRIKIDTRWFWYMTDGSLCCSTELTSTKEIDKKVFDDESIIPYIPVNRIRLMVAEAVWKKK